MIGHIFDITTTPELIEALEKEVENLAFHIKTGHHIDFQVNVIKLNLIGNNATIEQQNEFMQWDSTRFARRGIISRLKSKFNYFNFETTESGGINIYPK